MLNMSTVQAKSKHTIFFESLIQTRYLKDGTWNIGLSFLPESFCRSGLVIYTQLWVCEPVCV